MRHRAKKRKGEEGSAIVLVTFALVVVIGMTGLAVDAGQMYVTKQRAQAAADAAAQAGVMDLYNGNGTTTASSSAVSYAVLNGFIASEVTVDYPSCSSLPSCNGHITLPGNTGNLIRVVVQRTVNTMFMRVLGRNSATVSATAIAAISLTPSPLPIDVLHPTLSGSFSKNGSNTVTICGGPARAIQVNSTSTSSISISGNSGTIDLSHAGPLDSGNCTTGTGADLANSGVQALPSHANVLWGTKPGAYVDPASPIADPLINVVAPSKPAVNGASVSYTTTATEQAHGCPAACTVYSPGYWQNGIQVKNDFAVFRPGIYWIDSKGFVLDANSTARMATQAPDNTDPTGITNWTLGMLIYNNGNGILSIASNSGKSASTNFNCPNGGNCLVGSPQNSSYDGILFFQNRATATSLSHSFSGGGGLSLTGTIYLTHTVAGINSDGTYQSLTLSGNSGGATKVQGEIIVDALSLGGSSGITMNLIGTPTFSVRQVALVQ
ncbi:MAG TPA: pilus assembly protein TadG-related protein [Bryobacteraceae bacterium]|jgi:Flp pilus assembly protein TadG